MKAFRVLVSVEIIVDAENEEEAGQLAQPLIGEISSLSSGGVDVNDVNCIVTEPLEDEHDDSEPCGDPDCSCS